MEDVLIVDDDPAVRGTLTKMLEQAGFMVSAVDNGLAALAELREERVRAVVCDIKMPFLEGRRFYDELASAHPDIAERVIFVTGHGGDPQVRRFIERTGRPILDKPVAKTELVKAVQSLIDRAGGSR